MALSWKSHAHFSWDHLLSKMACQPKHFGRQCILKALLYEAGKRYLRITKRSSSILLVFLEMSKQLVLATLFF